MSGFVETLEGRALLSATPIQLLTDEGAAGAATKHIMAAMNTYQKTYGNDLKVITNDVKALGANAAANTKTLGKKLQQDEDKAIALFFTDFAKLTALETTALTKLNTAAFKAKSKQTNADRQAKAKLLQKFEAQGQTGTTKFLTDVGAAVTTLTTDATALGVANPDATKLNTDLQTIVTHAGANAANIQTATANATTATTKIITDLTP